MRKHHTWWVAFLGAGALTACGTAAPASADEGTPSGTGTERGESGHSLDGFTIGHLPEGLERHRVNASSSIDREGNRQSEITWGQGSDDLAGRVAVLRSDSFRELDDLRQGRFNHVSASALEYLGQGEDFDNGAYLSESTGDLFWLEEPGVAVLTHLAPGQWDREELERVAGAIAPATEESSHAPGQSTEEPEQDEEAVLDVPTQHEFSERPDVVADGIPEDMPGPARADLPAPADPQLQGPTGEEPQEGLPPEDVTRLPENAAFPDGIAFPDKSDRQGVPAFQQCLINRFEEHGGLSPEQEELSEETRAFVHRVQEAGELVGGERDRLMATSWYHGSQDDKLRAAEECVSEQGPGDQDADRSFGSVFEVITELDAQSRAAFDNVRVGSHEDAGAAAAAERDTAPIGPEEWERMREQLPWHLPTVHT